MSKRNSSAKHSSLPFSLPLPSPLKPWRGVMEANPCENHFNNTKLQKLLQHHGILQTTPSYNYETLTSTTLDREEHKIWNSEREKRKRFYGSFIADIVSSIREVDQARQSQFRNQLELWDKMYSNRIKRIDAYEKRLERKYGFIVDRVLKKELIKENLSKMPKIPSLQFDLVLRNDGTVMSPVPGPPNGKDVTKLIADLQSQLDLIREDHNAEIEQLTQRVTDLENAGRPSPLTPDTDDYREELDQIWKHIKEFKKSFEKHDTTMQNIQETVANYNTVIKQVQDDIKKQESHFIEADKELSTKLDLNVIILKGQILDLTNKFENFENDKFASLKKSVDDLKKSVDNIKQMIKNLRPPIDPDPEEMLPYVEKLPPKDLFEIDWKKEYNSRVEEFK